MSKKKNELVEKSDEALKEALAEKQRHLFDLRSQAVTAKLEDSSQIGKAKKEIARIKTLQRQRSMAAAK